MDRRGVALAFVAVTLFVLTGVAALAVDLGMLMAARTEAQRVADGAALSGALSLLQSSADADRARTEAIDNAHLNEVRRLAADVLPEDVDVDLANQRVTVRVLRTAARGNPLLNVFARLLGFRTSDVSALAAAHVGVAAGVECPVPFAIVDRWWEHDAGRLSQPGDDFDASEDTYNEGPLASVPGSPSQPTGYGIPDRGRVVNIRPSDISSLPVAGWYYPIVISSPGSNAYEAAIQGDCDDSEEIFEYGDVIDVEPGAMNGPSASGFGSLIAQDPTSYWGTGVNAPPGGCPMRPGVVDEDGNQLCVTSDRSRPVFLISPRDIPTSPGRHAVTLRNFVGIWVICVGILQPSQTACTPGAPGNPLGGPPNPNKGVHVRIMDYRGVNILPPGNGSGSLVRVIQLVR
jgi:hypothetical protein